MSIRFFTYIFTLSHTATTRHCTLPTLQHICRYFSGRLLNCSGFASAARAPLRVAATSCSWLQKRKTMPTCQHAKQCLTSGHHKIWNLRNHNIKFKPFTLVGWFSIQMFPWSKFGPSSTSIGATCMSAKEGLPSLSWLGCAIAAPRRSCRAEPAAIIPVVPPWPPRHGA